MSYRFDGTDDKFETAIGSCSLTAGYTQVIMGKLDAGVTWQSFLSNDVTASGSEVALGRHGGSGLLCTFIGGGAGGTPNAVAISSADGWSLYANRRPAGAGQTITHTKYPVGGSPTHTATAGTFGNALAQNKVVFGTIDGSDFYKGLLAVAAEFATNLSQTDLESLVTTFTREHWLSLSPVGLWDATDQFATDHTGNGADRTSITGTVVDADDPAGWDDWEGAPPVVPVGNMLRRWRY